MTAAIINLEDYRNESDGKKRRTAIINLAEIIELESPSIEEVTAKMELIMRHPEFTRDTLVNLLETNDHFFSSKTRFFLIDLYDLLYKKEQTQKNIATTIEGPDELRIAA